ncbi:hypothetical protein EWB00_011152 [Schistosoma japonicum]|uniref:Uncharacterized protein n=1 Tax=Schistosoma japonicum TaxID=6182 RepID=A0A4Z2DMQ1_SCHJA|nr:hypothetical protein EWB00_011152 [Schistosoma japonicum]
MGNSVIAIWTIQIIKKLIYVDEGKSYMKLLNIYTLGIPCRSLILSEDKTLRSSCFALFT